MPPSRFPPRRSRDPASLRAALACIGARDIGARSIGARSIGRLAGALSVTVALAGCAGLSRTDGEVHRIAALQPRLDALLAERIETNGPGLAVIVRRGGRVVYAGARGMADLPGKRPVSTATAFELASVSKPLTAVAALMLVEDGRLRLDDKLVAHVPWLPPAWSTITVRDLLVHESGIPDYLAGLDERALSRLDGATNATILERWRADGRLAFAPGTRAAYSSSNYLLLAEVVAAVSGQPFARFVADRMFTPLGMRCAWSESLPRPAGCTLALNFATTPLTNGIGLRTEGPTGLYASAEDLSAWLAAWLDGRLLAPATQATMTTRQSRSAAFQDGEFYGYGWALPPQGDPQDTYAHSGRKDGYRTVLYVNRARDVAYVILSNGGEPMLPVVKEIRRAIQAELEDVR